MMSIYSEINIEKNVDENTSWPSLREYFLMCPKVFGEPRKTSVRDVGFLTEIRNKYHRNKSQECHFLRKLVRSI
jgi:hypothetical protein